MKPYWGIVVVILLTIPQYCFADEFRVPYGVKKGKFIEQMALRGYDFSGGDDSDGNVEDKGNRFVVITNRTASEETMNEITEVAKECHRG